MKEKELIVDGYSVILNFQYNNYDDHVLKAVQVYGKYYPFLPFNVLMKIANKFLSKENLFLIELFQNSRKLYTWACCFDIENNLPIPSPYEDEGKLCEFEGIKYHYLDSSQVDILR